jgi:hypothetical protein
VCNSFVTPMVLGKLRKEGFRITDVDLIEAYVYMP